jgi:hypothetical protein
MNSSQLLYKISDLEYNIRMKEFEYTKASNAYDKAGMELHSASLVKLKEDLNKTRKEYDSIQNDNTNNITTPTAPESKKKSGPFNFRWLLNKK